MVEASPQSPENDSAWRLRFSLGWTLIALVFMGSASYLWSIHLRYLSIFDSINFAYSLTRFNTFLHMPQPPGYPGFVLIARIFNKVLPTPTSTFFVAGIMASLVTGLFAAKLGEMLSSAKVGIAAAVLIMLNPATFSSIVVSPVRVFLGLVSAAVGCLAWRMWTHPHEKWSFYAAWVTLGIGSSFRPELAAFLFPLVFVASLRQRQSWGALAAALLLFVGCIFLWLIPTARPEAESSPIFICSAAFLLISLLQLWKSIAEAAQIRSGTCSLRQRSGPSWAYWPGFGRYLY